MQKKLRKELARQLGRRPAQIDLRPDAARVIAGIESPVAYTTHEWVVDGGGTQSADTYGPTKGHTGGTCFANEAREAGFEAPHVVFEYADFGDSDGLTPPVTGDVKVYLRRE